MQLCSLICLSDTQIAHFSRISKLLKSIYIVKVMEPIEMNIQIKREKAAWKILRERQSENNQFFFFLMGIIYLFMAVLGLRFCARAFSSCGKRGHSSSRCAGLSLSRPLLLRSTGSRRTGSVIVPHGPSCSAACGIFPDQGSNPCPLHWQADSQPLRHQGSPTISYRI